ncbi:Rv1733c family protein [Phytohabitans rumicis]|nr:hypothetical protein [Phytohabitans rumicis]
MAIEQPDGGPYRLTAAVLSAAVLAAGIVLTIIGTATYTAARAEKSSRHQVTAHLVQDSGPPLIVPGAPVAVPPHGFAQWTAPDGARHTGLVRAEPYQKAGTAVSIWINTAGEPTEPPATADGAATRAVLAVAVAGSGLAAVIALVAQLTTAADRRRRYTTIDREWAHVEPEWTGRRS